MKCIERNDSILLYAADSLEPGEAAELREHLATGCPQCAATLTHAHATMAQLAMTLDPVAPPPTTKQRLLFKIGQPQASAQTDSATTSRKSLGLEKIILSSAVAALFAVAITLAAVWKFTPAPPPPDHSRDIAIAELQQLLVQRTRDLSAAQQDLQQAHTQLSDLREELNTARGRLTNIQFAEMTGQAQPEALGRAFIDTKAGKWYFFANGMKPPAEGKTYELWLICHDNKIPAGTFMPSPKGSAMLLGKVPDLPPNATVTIAVTDEPMGGVDSPTGILQIVGKVE